MAEETSNMEPDFSKLITTLSTISQTFSCLTNTITANGTTPFLQTALADTRKCLDKVSDMASQALDRSVDLKQKQVSIEALTNELQLAKAALEEKTRLHTDEVQNHENYVADLENRHTEKSRGFEAQLRDAASEVKTLRDNASEVNRLRGVASEVKRLQGVTSDVKKQLEEAKLNNVNLGEEIAQNNARFDSAKQQLQEDVARRQGTIKTLNKKIVEINTKHNGEIGRTKGELDLAKTQLQAATNEVGIKKSELDLANTRLEAATSELNAKTTQLAEVNVQHEATTRELGTKTAQLAEVNVQLEAATSEVNAKTAQLAEVNVQLEAATSEVNAKTTQLAQANMQHEETTRELSTRTTQLNQANVQLQQSTAKYNADLQELEEQFMALVDKERALAKRSDRETSIWRLKYENLKGTIPAEREHLKNEHKTKGIALELAMTAETRQLAAEKEELLNEVSGLKRDHETALTQLKTSLDSDHGVALQQALTGHMKREQDLVTQIADLNREHEAALRQCDDHKKKELDLQVTDLKKEHEAALAQQKTSLDNDHEAALREVHTEHEKKEHDLSTQVTDLKKEHEDALAQQKTSLDNDHEAALREVHTEHEKKEHDLAMQVTDLKKEHEDALAQQKISLDNAHEAALRQERTDHKKKEDDLASQVASLKIDRETTLARCQALQNQSEKDKTSLANMFHNSDHLTELQKNNIAIRDARILGLTQDNMKLHLDLQAIREQKAADLKALRERHASDLEKREDENGRLEIECNRLMNRKNEYRRAYLFYHDTFAEMQRAQAEESTPDRASVRSPSIPDGETEMVPSPQKVRQVVITHPSGRKRPRDAAEEAHETRMAKKVSTAQSVIDAEEDSFQYAGTKQLVPEVPRHDQEVTLVRTADAVTSGQQVDFTKTATAVTSEEEVAFTKTATAVTSEQQVDFTKTADAVTSENDLPTQIWSMFVLPLDLEEHEKDVLRDQVQDLCEKKQNSFEDVVAAIDHHVVGRFDRAPPEPRPCLMAQGMSQSCGAGGSRMTRTSCPYCKRKPNERVCCWARYVDGVGSGYPARVHDKISGSSKDWNRTVAEPLTIASNGRSVRWQLIRRKAHYQDPDY